MALLTCLSVQMWIMVVKIQHEDINVPHFTGDQEAKVVYASKDGKSNRLFAGKDLRMIELKEKTKEMERKTPL